MVWRPRADHGQKHDPGDENRSEGLDERWPITEALLWQFGFDGVGEEFLTVGASPGWRPCEKVEDGSPDGRHARLWRRLRAGVEPSEAP